MLIGPLIQVAGEGDGVLFRTSHHRDTEDVRVEIVYVCDRIIPHVERAAFFDEQLGSFLIRCWSIPHRIALLQRLDILVEYQLVRRPCPPGPRKCDARPSDPRRRATHLFYRESFI